MLIVLVFVFMVVTALAANGPANIKGTVILKNKKEIEFDKIGGTYDDKYIILGDDSAKMDYSAGSKVQVMLSRIKKMTVGDLYRTEKKFFFSGSPKGKKDKTIYCYYVDVELIMFDDTVFNFISQAVNPRGEWACGPLSSGLKIYLYKSGVRREVPIEVIKEILFD